MNIISGSQKHLVPDSYTVLELDTFKTDQGQTETAYCVIENIPLQDFPVLDAYIKVHNDLMRAYQNQNWEYCQSAVMGLLGKWNGELDTFYQDLADRVQDHADNGVGDDWDGSRRVG